MSKTENKLVNGVSCVLAAMQRASVMSAALDVAKFRATFKLTSMGRKRIASAIDDLLTAELIVNQFGPWVLAEIEHPNYQLSAATGNTVVLFHKEGAPNPGAEVMAGIGTKSSEDEDSEVDDDPENKKPAVFDATSANKTREFEDMNNDEDRAAWDRVQALADRELTDAFTMADIEVLWSMDLVSNEGRPLQIIPYLRVVLANRDARGTQLVKDAESDYYATIERDFTAGEWKRLLREGLVGEHADSPALSVEKLREALLVKENVADKGSKRKAKAPPKAKKAEPKKKPAPKAKKAPKRK